MSEKYAFIDAEYATGPQQDEAPTVTQMCEWLGVAKSGYYDWRKRPESETEKRREMLKLKIKIKAIFEYNNEEYGYRRVHAVLARSGGSVDDETVRKLMRELGLEPCQPRPWRRSLSELRIRQSVGRTGICYDNALSESVNGTLKVELVHRTAYATRRQASNDIARWIELRYNKTRLHSGLGYRTPQEAMDEFLNRQEAA